MSEYFTYNVFNQLKSYRNTEGKTASYEYLPNNYRYSKTVGSTTTRFLWDGDYVAGELDSTGNISKKYFYGMDMLSDDSGDNYIYDIHGSVTNVLNSSGTKTGTYEYNAFGRDEKSTINSISNPWQYCGEYKDNETGLIYLRNRYYDPETGRFINEDPIRSGGNWYSYASQNPIMFIDPSGLKTKAEIDSSMSQEDKNKLVKYQNQYKICEAVNDFKGMFDAYEGATELRKSYDSEYRDIQDNGFMLYIGEYSNDEGVSGNIYMITNYDRAEEIYYNVKDRVGDNDYICADFRKENHYSEDGANNPTIKVFDSYRADESTMENISHKLIIYDTENPSNWNRSYVSILREWKAHNAMYNLGVARNRTKDVDLDSKAENTIMFYNYQYN